MAGLIVQRAPKRGFAVYAVAALVNIAVVYVIGMVWFWGIKAFYMNDPIGMWTLFVTCFVPTIGVDIVKALAAAALAARLVPVVGTYRVPVS